MNFKKVQKITALAIASVSLAVTGQAAQAGETFQVNGGYALNTNNSFRLIDGNPRMSLYQHNLNDPINNSIVYRVIWGEHCYVMVLQESA